LLQTIGDRNSIESEFDPSVVNVSRATNHPVIFPDEFVSNRRKKAIRAVIGADRESAAIDYVGPPDLTLSQLV
jgi:hypothetical protein